MPKRSAKFLTDSMVRALKLPDHRPDLLQKVFFDASVPGFGVRVTRNGAKTWMALYRHQGRLRWLKIGTYPVLGLADARTLAREKLASVQRGVDVAAEKQEERTAPTFEELAERYMVEYAAVKKKASSAKGDRNILNHDLLPVWKHRKAADIKPRDVIEMIDRIARGDGRSRPAPIQANRVLALVSKIYNFGRNKLIVDDNPAYRIDKPGDEKDRDRVLSADEIHALWNVLDKETLQIQAIFKLGLLTAQRKGEICGMLWSEIDTAGVWTIPAEKAKNGLAHRVPLGPMSKGILNALRESVPKDDPLVFRSSRTNEAVDWIHAVKERIAAAAGLKDFKYHDLRRTAASHMASHGIDHRTIGKILNHMETDVTAVYNRHGYDQEKRAALLKWERHLNGVVSDRPRHTTVVAIGQRT